MGDDSTAKEGKKWFRVSKTSQIYKVVNTLNDKSTPHRIREDAAMNIPRAPTRKMWEIELYKMIGSSRYKVIVEYDHMKYCELKVKNKGKTWEFVDCKMDVEYPNEFAGGAGGGLDGGSLGGFGGTKDGIMKSLSAFSSSNAVKLGKVKYKPKKKTKAPTKLASGHNLFSSMGTAEIKTRDYKAGASAKAAIDTSKDKNFITAKIADQLGKAFDLMVQRLGEYDDGLTGAEKIGRIPQDKIMAVFEQAKFELTEVQRKRIIEFARLDKNEFIELSELLEILNRTYNEQERGHFHMTVRELQDLFQQHDVDFSGSLDAVEVTKILNKVHLVTDVDAVKDMMSKMDKDGDATVDFEEFMSMTQEMYKERGGTVVANKSGPVQFNQTRTIIDDLRDKVERHHLMITHLKAQIQNLEEQLEVMNTIEQHSALQNELNKTREEKKRLAKLRDEMEMQHKGWMRDIKGVHAREKRDTVEKVQFVQQQQKEAQQALDYVVHEYEKDFGEAMGEVGEIMQSLGAVLEFAEKTIENVEQDSQNCDEMRTLAQTRVAKYQAGTKGTVFNPAVYDSATAIQNFLQSKTSALEQWLISRTQFTQSDREKYLKRVEEVKKMRETYDANKVELTKQCESVTKSISKYEKELSGHKAKNDDLRKKLLDPTERVHDEAKMKELQDELELCQKQIKQGHIDKLEWSKKLYPEEHKLAMERSKIGLLQVELGEMKVLLESVEHHKDVEAATMDSLPKKAKKLKAKGY